MKTLLQTISGKASMLNPDLFSDDEKIIQWIGRNPVTDEAIADAKKTKKSKY